MPMSAKQTALYWRTWAKISAALAADLPEATKAEIASQRRAQHKAAGCPASSKSWGNLDLTRWLYLECRINDPDNLPRLVEFEQQLDAQSHPEAARIFRIRAILSDLARPVAYAAACAHQPDLPADLCKWPAASLQAALIALTRTARHTQLPGKPPF